MAQQEPGLLFQEGYGHQLAIDGPVPAQCPPVGALDNLRQLGGRPQVAGKISDLR